MNALWHPAEVHASVPVLNKPLLRRAPLEPGESLPSLLARLVRLNHYSSPSILERVALARSDWPDSVECPNKRELFERLALLTSLPAFELYRSSDHRFLPSCNAAAALREQCLPDWVSPVFRRQLLHSSRVTQYCPQCLQEGAYHRQMWRPIAMAICLAHRCLLMIRCPHCEASVSMAALVQARCDKCDGDLCHPPTSAPIVGEWEWIAQQTLGIWLLGEENLVAQHAWPAQSPEVLYRLAEMLAFGVLTCPERFAFGDATCPIRNQPIEWLEHISHYPPADLCWAYSLSLRWMMNWPEGFREFMHYYVPDPDIPLEQGLAVFYRRGLNRIRFATSFEFVWEAYHRYQSERTFSASLTPIPLWTCIALEEAQLQLKVETCILDRLVQLGQLTCMEGRTTHGTKTFFRRVDIRRTQAQWSIPLTQNEAAVWLGISPGLLEKFSKAHCLRGQWNPDRTTKLFTKMTVARLLQRVDAVAWIHEPQEPDLSLTEAAEYLAGIGWSEVHLLRAVIARQLCPYRLPKDGEAVDLLSLRFTVADLEYCARQIMHEHQWVSEDFTARFFGVDNENIQRWCEHGWLKPVTYFPPQQPLFFHPDLELLKAELVPFPEARQILQMGKAVLLRRIARGKIIPAYSPPTAKSLWYLFLRKDVEKLARRRKRTKPEAGLIICG